MFNKKKLIFIIISPVLIFIACFLIGEVFLRAYYFFSGEGGYAWIPDYYLGVAHPPNSSFVYKEPSSNEFNVKRKTNSFGLIGKEIKPRKPENSFRIIVLGDSFTEALQVNQGKNFCELLENKLNKELFSQCKYFEVLNAGMSNYSPIAEYLYLKRELLKLSPDMIILQLFANDVYEDNKIGKMSVFDKDNLPVKINRVFYKNKNPVLLDERLYRIKKYFVDRSVLLQCIERALQRGYKKNKFHKEKSLFEEFLDVNQFFIIQDYVCLSKDLKFRDRALANTGNYIKAIRDICSQNDIELFIFLIPPQSQLKLNKYGEHCWYFPRPPNNFLNREIRRFAKREKINYLDLLSSFEKNKKKSLFLDKDGHLTEDGHRLVAQDLFDYLIRKRLIKL